MDKPATLQYIRETVERVAGELNVMYCMGDPIDPERIKPRIDRLNAVVARLQTLETFAKRGK